MPKGDADSAKARTSFSAVAALRHVRGRLRGLLCVGPIGIGLVVIAGWAWDFSLLKSVAPGLPTMKVNTALGLVAAGLGTLLAQKSRAGARKPHQAAARLAVSCLGGGFALAIGVVTLVEYGFGLRLAVDEWLFADPHTTSPPFPGRMSPATATALACAGSAILLLGAAGAPGALPERMRRRLARIAHVLALVPGIFAYLGLAGYAYNVDGFYNLGAYIAPALHTAIGLAMLAAAILLTQARRGWGHTLRGFPAAQDALRLLLPVSLIFPFVAGLAVVRGARARIYDPFYGPALFAAASASASVCMAWVGAMVVRGKEERLKDFTARLAASDLALRAANESLEARVREEVAAREAAMTLLAHGQRMEALGQLAGGIAHDFNNVMQAIQGGAGLIRRRTTDPRAIDDIARMVELSVQRGISVTRRLLSFARRNELRARRVDPAGLLAELREVLVHGFGHLIEIRVRISHEGPLSWLVADKGQLETVMINLAANGRDAMRNGGTLTLSAAEEIVEAGAIPGRFVRLEVSDTGEGMSEAVLARAAEPFFTTKAPGQGTGLGLAMARSFAEQSGGRLTIASVAGQGTTVTLWLPAVVPETCQELPADAAPAAAAAPGVTILVVDDEDLVRDVLATGLTDVGYDVLQAADGTTALSMLKAGAQPALMLTDYAMPGMNGLTLIKEARALLPQLPAVLLTGHAALASGGETAGIHLLRKPVKGAELAACIAAVIAPGTRQEKKEEVLF